MIDTARAPTKAEIADSFRAGARVVAGLPTFVQMADGSYATLDVDAAMRGDPDPWLVTWSDRIVVLLHSADDMSLHVGGMHVDGGNFALAIKALRLSDKASRYGNDGDAIRLDAGKVVMGIDDAMVRARLLDHCDAWSAVLGDLIDQSSVGSLHTPCDSALRCNLLRVTCPSTGRTYVLCVPKDCKTAVEARRWTFGDRFKGVDPEVES